MCYPDGLTRKNPDILGDLMLEVRSIAGSFADVLSACNAASIFALKQSYQKREGLGTL